MAHAENSGTSLAYRASHRAPSAAAGRLYQALLQFRAAQTLCLQAHRRLQGLAADDIEAFWLAPGGRLKRHLEITASQAVDAYRAFATTGQITSPEDQYLIAEAERVLAAGTA